jgi:phosphoribosylaminoimidazole-succinocarboxamide synthase
MQTQETLKQAVHNCLRETNFSFGTKKIGKVRDVYDMGDKLLLITTDRQSAFDQVLAEIPFKGQVLNQISAYWFEQTKDIVKNHMIALPDPNALIAEKCKVYPVEVIVRGYITGVTNTSAWYNYERGERLFCGVQLPEGLKKNQQFDTPIITPTTKPETGHDEKISSEEIIARGLVPKERWEEIERVALALFARGTELAAQRGLILVDTKYEFGQDDNGNLVLVDEIHTPDSSRYWKRASYEERFIAGQEPESLDKEFLRIWLKEHGFVYDRKAPEIPEDVRAEFAGKYIELYETITGLSFEIPDQSVPILQRIEANISAYLS